MKVALVFLIYTSPSGFCPRKRNSDKREFSLVAGRWSLVAGVESQIGCRAIDCMCGANGCTESRLG
jgi:hypothetical protein